MFNPSRLVLARRRRGWTKTRLADHAGVSTRSITNYESGSRDPSAETVSAVASALTFPEAFFYSDDIELLAPEAASFRALTKMTASQRDQALGAGTIALLLDDWIERHFVRPSPDIPEFDTTDAEHAAEATRAEWALGQRPVPNMVHLLEAHGTRVFALDDAGREVDAFSFWRAGRPYVLLNTLKSAEHGRFDAAHELGHLILHRNGDRGKHAEAEANAFASAFLMPKASVLAAGIQNPTLRTIVHRKSEWKVSAVALIYRLHHLGVLTDWQYRSLFIAASKKGYRTTEPNPLPRETSQVLQKVFQHLRSAGRTRRAIADELRLTVEDLDDLLLGLVLLGHESNGMAPTAPVRGHLRLVEPELSDPPADVQ